MAEAADRVTTSQTVTDTPDTSRLSDTAMIDRPTCIICLGMAGSGKTTFIQVCMRPTQHTSSYCLLFSENYCSLTRIKDSTLCCEP